MTTITDLTDAEIASTLAHHRRTLTQLVNATETTKNKIASLEAEQARRQLEVYWKANPNETRFDIGDKLIITDEFLTYRDETGGWPTHRSGIPAGTICSVRSVDVVNKCWSIDIGGSSTGLIPTVMIQGMRLTYLDSVASVADDGNGVAG